VEIGDQISLATIDHSVLETVNYYALEKKTLDDESELIARKPRAPRLTAIF